MISNHSYVPVKVHGRASTVHKAFIRLLSTLAREKNLSSLARHAVVLWRTVTNLHTHLDARTLLKHPLYAEVAQKNPRFVYKYLTSDYLLHGLTVGERAICFLHHYRRLSEILPESILRQVLWDEVTLHEIFDGENCFAITMGLSGPNDKEGEMSLNLRVNGDASFILSFTIVPGRVVQSKAAEVFLISRLQGAPGHFRQVRLATRTLHDVAPDAMLLAALQGMAMSYGISELVAVNSTNQIYYSDEFASQFKDAYDDFFAGLGFNQNAAGLYFSSIPIVEKPLERIKPGHKIRTREKRAFKKEIMLSCAEFFGKRTVSPGSLKKNAGAKLPGYPPAGVPSSLVIK
jgi:uncharacterized protein VirK/YbjX